MVRGRAIAVTAGLAVALVGIGMSAASASAPLRHSVEDGPGNWPTCRTNINGVIGTLTAIDGGTLTIHSDKEGTDKMVTTSAATRFMRIEAGSVSDINNGDRVLVFGSSDNGTIAAKNVLDPGSTRVKEPMPGHGSGSRFGAALGLAFGTVADKTAGGFAVATGDGSRAPVTTSSDTKVVRAREAGLGDLKIGERISAVGEPGANGSLAASSVEQGMHNVGTMSVAVPPGAHPPVELPRISPRALPEPPVCQPR